MSKFGLQYQLKITFEKPVAALLMIILLPFLLIISISIKVSGEGPVIFKQVRLGYKGNFFNLYKFRTMKANSKDIRNPDGTTYNASDDPRLTRIGKILRRLSIDELPQLLNILKGEMSFIGPRPDLPEFYYKYTDQQLQKLDVYPGISGLAQISGRNTIPLDKRFEYDVEYVNNYSLMLDLRIFIQTFVKLFRQEGVYNKPVKSGP